MHTISEQSEWAGGDRWCGVGVVVVMVAAVGSIVVIVVAGVRVRRTSFCTASAVTPAPIASRCRIKVSRKRSPISRTSSAVAASTLLALAATSF